MYGLGLTMMVLPVSRAGMILPSERMMGKFHLQRPPGQQLYSDPRNVTVGDTHGQMAPTTPNGVYLVNSTFSSSSSRSSGSVRFKW